jgi:hypothetical protein
MMNRRFAVLFFLPMHVAVYPANPVSAAATVLLGHCLPKHPAPCSHTRAAVTYEGY